MHESIKNSMPSEIRRDKHGFELSKQRINRIMESRINLLESFVNLPQNREQWEALIDVLSDDQEGRESNTREKLLRLSRNWLQVEKRCDKEVSSTIDGDYTGILLERMSILEEFIGVNVASNKKPITLCIGAGVTAKYVGSWYKLISKLLSDRYLDRLCLDDNYEYLEDDAKEFFDSLVVNDKNGIQATELGEYLLLDSMDKSDCIESELRSKTWREYYLASQIQSKMPEPEQLVLKEYKPDEDTLSALLTLCMCRRKNNEFAVRHIIDYNYDTMVEDSLQDEGFAQTVEKKYGCALKAGRLGRRTQQNRKLEVFHQAGEVPDEFHGYENESDKLYLYHVHGCLKRGESPLPVIFSESSYDNLGNKFYDWCNQVQAELCLRFPLLFIGFSGNDPNFRRLLKQMSYSTKRPESYLFMRLCDVRKIIQFGEKDYSKILDEIVDDNDKKKKKEKLDAWIDHAMEVLLETIEYYYHKTFNIRILWYEDYKEIAKTLMLMVKSCMM